MNTDIVIIHVKTKTRENKHVGSSEVKIKVGDMSEVIIGFVRLENNIS